MGRDIRVILEGDAKESFKKLNEIVSEQKSKNKTNSQEIQLLKSIKNKIELLKLNPDYGDNIPKSLIPKEYIVKHDATNLFRMELAHYWRMLYTIKGDRIEVICFILDILDHSSYNKKFGYKKR